MSAEVFFVAATRCDKITAKTRGAQRSQRGAQNFGGFFNARAITTTTTCHVDHAHCRIMTPHYFAYFKSIRPAYHKRILVQPKQGATINFIAQTNVVIFGYECDYALLGDAINFNTLFKIVFKTLKYN